MHDGQLFTSRLATPAQGLVSDWASTTRGPPLPGALHYQGPSTIRGLQNQGPPQPGALHNQGPPQPGGLHNQGPSTTRALHNQGASTTRGPPQPGALHYQRPSTTRESPQPGALHNQGAYKYCLVTFYLLVFYGRVGLHSSTNEGCPGASTCLNLALHALLRRLTSIIDIHYYTLVRTSLFVRSTFIDPLIPSPRKQSTH